MVCSSVVASVTKKEVILLFSEACTSFNIKFLWKEVILLFAEACTSLSIISFWMQSKYVVSCHFHHHVKLKILSYSEHTLLSCNYHLDFSATEIVFLTYLSTQSSFPLPLLLWRIPYVWYSEHCSGYNCMQMNYIMFSSTDKSNGSENMKTAWLLLSLQDCATKFIFKQWNWEHKTWSDT